MKGRSSYYSVWYSYLNFFWSFDGKWKFRTENTKLVADHVESTNEIINAAVLKEGRINSEAIESDSEIYTSCVKYNSGNCHWNADLSRGKVLGMQDQKDCNNIRTGLQMVKPLDSPVVLFHGLEPGLNYGIDMWKINSIYKFPFFLSKTLSWKVATFFALLSSQSKYFQRYLLCKYPKGSRHICLNIRTQYNDEFEFLAVDDTFKFTEKVYHFGLLPRPTLRVYYVMEHSENI